MTSSFTTLATGCGSRRITREFWATEESRRVLLVDTLLEQIGEHAGVLGPLCPIDEVAEVLFRAESAARDAFRELLLDPGVGNGCAYALRRLRGGARGSAPLWVDLGVLHALALVAAARSGLKWTVRLPLRDGTVMLHTLGLARFPSLAGPDATVEASAEAGRISFSAGGHELVVPADRSDVEPTEGAPGWWALRRVRVDGEVPLTVWLDDLDPLRDLAEPVPPARLDPEAFARWRRLIAGGWELLCRDHRPDAEAMADGVVAIVPLQTLPGLETRSASNGEAFGGIMLSEPPDVVTMAVSLVHEYQHIQLGALLHLLPLTKPDDGSLYYAPWRDDPRPLAGLIQGVYAFFGIARFWRIRRSEVDGAERDLADFEYAYARQQTSESVRTVLRAPGLTDSGRRLFEGLSRQVDQWSRRHGDDVDPRIERLAQITADSHRVGWRLRHLHPTDDEVATLTARLSHGDLSATNVLPAAIRPHPQLLWRQRIPSAARRYAQAAAAQGRDPLATGENALLAQDAQAALEAFVGALDGAGSSPDVPDDEARAWAGLAVSLAAAGGSAAATALAERPDLVRAVYAESAHLSASPIDIAEWLAPAVATPR